MPESRQSDEALLRRTQSGGRDAFATLVDRYQRRAFAVALRMLGRRQDAEDAIQQAFLRLYEARAEYNSRWRLSTWFYRILINACVDELRRRRPQVPLEDWDNARRIMEQLDLRLIEAPPIVPAQLDVAASPVGITRVLLRRTGHMPPQRREAGRIGQLLEQARKELAEYLAGERTFFSVPVDLSRVPAFERAALEIAAQIPYGEVRPYKWIAERLGRPDAARAVGNAMASNPVPIIVPCHRVVKADGGLGGYSFGTVRKESLLALERGRSAYVGCITTRIFCRRGCRAEQRIHEGNRINFLVPDDARLSGYAPCSICRPT
jgi:O-6-methylguanine DNA methyltransferase